MAITINSNLDIMAEPSDNCIWLMGDTESIRLTNSEALKLLNWLMHNVRIEEGTTAGTYITGTGNADTITCEPKEPSE